MVSRSRTESVGEKSEERGVWLICGFLLFFGGVGVGLWGGGDGVGGF